MVSKTPKMGRGYTSSDALARRVGVAAALLKLHLRGCQLVRIAVSRPGLAWGCCACVHMLDAEHKTPLERGVVEIS